MLKQALLATLLSSSFSAVAAEDLVLPGERWLANNGGYVCGAATTQKVSGPEALEEIQASFKTLTSDYSLDNGLIKATFVEDENLCNYSALMFADNAGYTMKLVDSKAYSTAKDASCAVGKALLDEALAFNKYLYWGRPHHITLMIPDSDGTKGCAADQSTVGIDFVVAGRL